MRHSLLNFGIPKDELISWSDVLSNKMIKVKKPEKNS